MEVTDRIASLEQRVQLQEDDIQLLKSALADVVRRLSVTEEQQAVLSRKGPTKGGRWRRTGAAVGSAAVHLVSSHFKCSFLKSRSKVNLPCCVGPGCTAEYFSHTCTRVLKVYSRVLQSYTYTRAKGVQQSTSVIHTHVC